jgi:hypothetical protein
VKLVGRELQNFLHAVRKNIKRKDLGDRAIADVIENARLVETVSVKSTQLHQNVRLKFTVCGGAVWL